MCRHPPAFTSQPWQAWQAFDVKDTAKGPAVWRAKAATFHPKREGCRPCPLVPARAHWPVVPRNVPDEAQVKYFASNAPAGSRAGRT